MNKNRKQIEKQYYDSSAAHEALNENLMKPAPNGHNILKELKLLKKNQNVDKETKQASHVATSGAIIKLEHKIKLKHNSNSSKKRGLDQELDFQFLERGVEYITQEGDFNNIDEILSNKKILRNKETNKDYWTDNNNKVKISQPIAYELI